MGLYRIDKYLADAGIGTRSQIKDYIKKGMVQVNHQPVLRPEHKITSETDVISFQGEVVQMSDYEYYILNKPAGYVSATRDNTCPTVLELVESCRKDLFPVGRLDKDTEGLLLITNDGALSHQLLSPKHHVDKVYYAKVKGIITSEDIEQFKQGLEIGDPDFQVALPATLVIDGIDRENDTSYVYITIQEGKYHQVKRMVHKVGKEVLYLKRIQFGNLTLPEDLSLGASRPLTAEELLLLKNEREPGQNHFNNLKC